MNDPLEVTPTDQVRYLFIFILCMSRIQTKRRQQQLSPTLCKLELRTVEKSHHKTETFNTHTHTPKCIIHRLNLVQTHTHALKPQQITHTHTNRSLAERLVVSHTIKYRLIDRSRLQCFRPIGRVAD